MMILGMGTAVPLHAVDQRKAAELAEERCRGNSQQTRWLRRAYSSAGVNQRHSELLALKAGTPVYIDLFPPCRDENDRGPSTSERMAFYATHAGPLAARAATSAIADAQVKPPSITHLITASCTGFAAPGLDYSIIRDLQLSPRVSRLHIGFMGCHAALNAMQTAAAITHGDPAACVLISAVELCTLHFQYGWDADAVLANALFADGAAAIVARGDRPSPPAAGQLGLAATGSVLLPATCEAMSWRIGDHGFVMTLSREVPALIEKHLRPFVSEWLGEHGLRIAEIGSWAIHPGGPRILAAAEEALGLPQESTRVSREVLRDFGNMSSPTVLFVLDRLRRDNAARPIVALAFGPGLIVQAALFT